MMQSRQVCASVQGVTIPHCAAAAGGGIVCTTDRIHLFHRSAPKTMPRAIIPTAPALVQDAAAVYAAASAAAENAEAAKRNAAADLLKAMVSAGFSPDGQKSARTESGTVTINKGKESITIVCAALRAEIEAMRKRSIRTGRGELRIGDPYIALRR